MSFKIKTIEDMEKLYYSEQGSQIVAKSDAPVISSTTGVYNAVFGAKVWNQLNTEANVFAVLPKYPQRRSGWRVETARPATSGGGVSENGTLPDTIKPTWKEVSTKPKSIAHTFDVSEVQEFLANSEDDAIGAMAQMRARMAEHHKEMLNVMLLTDVDTLASDNMESLDRVVSSYSEVSDSTIGLDAGDSDIYSIDRDASSSWADAYVDHNSGTDRSLTDSILRTLINTTHERGANPNGQVFITGYDTMTAIEGLYESQVRYNPMGETMVELGVNGVKTPKGADFGMKVRSIYGIPVILSKDVAKDTISRIYLLDISDPEGYGEPRLGLRIAKPTQYFEAGMNTGDPFGIDRLGTEGMYRTMGELICTNFRVQGKVRDLKT